MLLWGSIDDSVDDVANNTACVVIALPKEWPEKIRWRQKVHMFFASLPNCMLYGLFESWYLSKIMISTGKTWQYCMCMHNNWSKIILKNTTSISVEIYRSWMYNTFYELLW